MPIPAATLTVQYVLDRAASFSPANAALMTNTVEMVSRVRYKQREVFTRIATRSREYFVLETPLPSSASLVGGRTLDLTLLLPPVERVLQLQDGDGNIVNQVDFLDMDAELAPRYYAQGTSLVEVGTEWDAIPGETTMTVTYCYAPNDLSPAGPTSQLLTLPDQWVDILVGDLAAYVALKDYGRPSSEVATAAALADTRLQEFQSYLDQAAGVRAMRVDVPHPTGTPK